MDPDRALTAKDAKFLTTTDKKVRDLGFVLIPIELARRLATRPYVDAATSRDDFELRRIIGDPPAVGGE